jgi:hypothetical protein
MPTDFASYDLDQNGTISPEEWDAFYANAGGGQPPANPAAPAQPFNIDDFIGKVSSGNFTDDDMLAFSNWYMGQQMGQQAKTIQLKADELDYLQAKLGLDQEQLETAKMEIEFQQGPYFDFVTGPQFQHQVQKDQWEFEMAGIQFDLANLNFETQKYLSDNQRAMADVELGKSKEYAQAQFYNTEQAKYGADAARWQYLQMTNGRPAPSGADMPAQRRGDRSAQAVLGAY